MSGLRPSDFKEILRKGEYSDFKICCKGTEFNVHKFILGCSSSFFGALFRRQCKVKTTRILLCFRDGFTEAWQETLKDTIVLPDDDPETIGRAIDFLYTGSYRTESVPLSMEETRTPNSVNISSREDETQYGAESRPDATFLNHVLVYQAANKYVMPMLMHYTSTSVKGCLDDFGPGDCFIEGLELLYKAASMSDCLRTVVVQFCVEKHKTLSDYERIEEIMMEQEPIAWTVGIRILHKANRQIQELEQDLEEELGKSKTKNNAGPECRFAILPMSTGGQRVVEG